MQGVIEVDHPLIGRHLTVLRSTTTRPAEFRSSVRRLSTLLAYEATKDLGTRPTRVETPLAEAEGCELTERIGLVPILRAGLGMVDPVLDLIPSSEVWHLGLYRDETTAQPVTYYDKLPRNQPVDTALVLDPMLATGGSAVAALETIYQWGVGRAKVLSIIASRAGVDLVKSCYPDAQVYVCKVDPDLNDCKYIVPGLGDAGDRSFNTVSE